jgi:hypothetical protein
MAQKRNSDPTSTHLETREEIVFFRTKRVAQIVPQPTQPIQRNGGARRDRTDDLMLAKHALSQLSYGPNGETRKETRLNLAQKIQSEDSKASQKSGGPGKT